MDLNRYTQKSQEAILAAQNIAREYNHQSVEPIHILLALLRQQEGVVPAIVTQVAGSVMAIREEVALELENHPRVYGAAHEIGRMSLLWP